MLQGYLRADGRKGIRNVLVVAYLVECAHHVAREIAAPFRDRGVHLIGFAGRILEGRATLPEVGREIFDLVQRVGNGEPTKSEGLGHQEFILTYKSFEPLGPACLPV